MWWCLFSCILWSCGIRLSICLSVRLSRSWVLSKRINISSKFFHHFVAKPFQIFRTKRGGAIPTGASNMQVGYAEIAIGYRRLLDVRSVKNIYRGRSWVCDTVGHAPLAIDRLLDVRTTKWQKQLPTTMQCSSHSRRRTIECLFVTACSMDQYAEENRKEFNCTQWYIWSWNN